MFKKIVPFRSLFCKKKLSETYNILLKSQKYFSYFNKISTKICPPYVSYIETAFDIGLPTLFSTPFHQMQ